MGNTTIQTRRDTAATWTTNNPTLAAGEMGLETDTNKFKFGDGTTAWTSLSYAGGAAGSFKYGLYSLSANQTARISVGNHIEFNTDEGSLGGLATGSGQENGIITLASGKTYKITGVCRFGHSSPGYTTYQVYDRTNSQYLGRRGLECSVDNSGEFSPRAELICIVTPASQIDIDIRFVTTDNSDQVYYNYSWILIEEYGGY